VANFPSSEKQDSYKEKLAQMEQEGATAEEIKLFKQNAILKKSMKQIQMKA